ncbi:hypothetical protein [Actinophytocola sediminis]
MSTGAIIVLVVVLLAVVLAVGWFVGERLRSRGLRNRFGPEYDRRVSEAGNRREAERELAERRRRHAEFDLRPLSDELRARFTDRWTRVQERFVDRPGGAVVEAESLVQAVMHDRGYPVGEFERQAEDLSVANADAVEHYREGHEILARHQKSAASTEELRRALVGYREIFNALIGTGAAEQRRYDHATR